MNFSLLIIVLVPLFQTITDIKDVSQDRILRWKNQLRKSKIKLGNSRVNYYANHITTYDLILAGDIEHNPGPGLRTKPKASKCNVCDKAVGTDRKRVKCDVHHNLTHVSYLNISKHQQKNYTVENVPLLTCNECLLSTLPFFKTRDLYASFNTEIHDHPPATITHLKKLNENKNNTSIVHLNVQVLMSTYYEFSLMLGEYQFDVIALSETWLKDYKYQQNYVQLNGYNKIFKNRTNKRGGGVGFYIKDQLEYKKRKDLTSKHESLEVLLIEIHGRNKLSNVNLHSVSTKFYRSRKVRMA